MKVEPRCSSGKSEPRNNQFEYAWLCETDAPSLVRVGLASPTSIGSHRIIASHCRVHKPHWEKKCSESGKMGNQETQGGTLSAFRARQCEEGSNWQKRRCDERMMQIGWSRLGGWMHWTILGYWSLMMGEKGGSPNSGVGQRWKQENHGSERFARVKLLEKCRSKFVIFARYALERVMMVIWR